MPHLVDLLIDRGIFLDIRIGLRHICFRLIVVVVTHEIFNCIVWEKLFELPVELGGQGLIGGENKGGPLTSCHDACYGKRLSRACYAKQYLMSESLLHSFRKGVNGMLLITFDFEW